ncbi:hypothetical protein [Pseudonocardia sp. T1-2H]|uniref:hypothetical protein n=1 Tax=Pseudonocardia sp. T1-2H TaxID=3128899 RepID=UPI0031013A67
MTALLAALTARLANHDDRPAYTEPLGTVADREAVLDAMARRRSHQCCDDCKTCPCGKPSAAVDPTTDHGFCADHILAAPDFAHLRPVA